jgi:arylsulfatase A-like enzyme
MCQAGHKGWESLRCSGGEDGKTLDRALAWAEGLGDSRPYFLWVHLFAAHGPYYNGGDLAATTFDPDYEGPLGPRKWQLDPVMTEGLELTPADRRHLNALYDAALAGTDHHVRRLIEGLRELGLLERTLIIFLSDHGEELYEHNQYLYHACSVYQTTLHVPLGVSAPGLLPAGGVVEPLVELSDVAPTVLALLGLPDLPGTQGVSLLPYLARPEARGAGKPAFSEYEDTRIHTVLADGFKLVDNPNGHQPHCFPGAPPGHYPLAEIELYDLRQDPGETTNLAQREPQRVAALQELIRRRFAGLAPPNQEQEIPEELRKELEALGYVAP